jgi:hypothetical protein
MGTIPDDHFDVDENPDNRDKDKVPLASLPFPG